MRLWFVRREETVFLYPLIRPNFEPMPLDPAFISEMKQQLEAEKARLESELSRFAKPTSRAGDYTAQIENIGTDEDDNATEVEDYVDDLGLERTLETKWSEVHDALEKIDKGTYGICEKTGKEITPERLRAYPAARTAIV